MFTERAWWANKQREQGFPLTLTNARDEDEEAIPELRCASVLKRVLVQNLSWKFLYDFSYDLREIKTWRGNKFVICIVLHETNLFWHRGRGLMSQVNIFPRLKTYDFRREGRICFRHSKGLWTLVTGEMFAAVSVIFNREIGFEKL